jgi:cellulose synthase/poly-beta-1,6-N-acetylglucosamine synthase-like glycosyltransferase
MLGKLLFLFEVFLLFAGLYQLIITCFGWSKAKQTPSSPPQKSFAILIAAHNEEKVLGALIDNLNKLDYPKELYDICVICDNCNDGTADVARKHGALAFERYHELLKGKGYAIDWMLDILWKQDKQYDAVVMFDADNLVNPDFLTLMNNDLCAGSKVIQGYLDTKNPTDSWITASFAVSYYFSNRFLQTARRNLKLANYLGGTGMCFDAALLKRIGWGSTSLVEDLEFSMKCIKEDIYPTFNYEAKVYDEKPLTFMASCRQRLRWMQGHFEVAKKYSLPLLWQAIRKRSWKKFDASLHSLNVYNYFIGSIMLLSIWLGGITPSWTGSFLEIQIIQTLFNSITVMIFIIMLISIFVEKANLKIFKYMILFPIFVFSWLPITCYAFFTQNNKQWSHTEHTRVIRLEELKTKQVT